jgi:Flp pilus assembly protein TadG
MRLRRRIEDRRKGASAAEMAVVLPTLMLIVLGCVDFGRAAYYHIAIDNAARAAAGYAIMNSYTSDTAASWESQVQQAARNEMAQQTGYDSSRLTTEVTVNIEGNGLRRVRVVATYSSFETVFNWPGIPSSLDLRCGVTMYAIR